MKSITFAHFEAGIVDDPSNESKGGFEFASGIDIFSEPGVAKASFAMAAVSGLPTISSMPKGFATAVDSATLYGFLAVNDKIYVTTDGINFSLFLTDSQGTINNLSTYNGYVFYVSGAVLGRCPITNSAAKTDNWQTLASASAYPMKVHAGNLQIGNGRYISSIDELFNFTAQAMKVPTDWSILTLATYQGRLMIGTAILNNAGVIVGEDATVFDWDGIILSSGTALPNAAYPLSKRGMNLLLTTGQGLFGFPDKKGELFTFDGARFNPFRQLSPFTLNTDLALMGSSGCEHLDTLLFAGTVSTAPGIFQLKGGAIVQAFVGAPVTPGAAESAQLGLVASGFDGKVFVSYFRAADSSYHVDYLTSNRQNNAVMRTLWHRITHLRGVQPDRLKRWGGVKLNLKPLTSGCSVAVAYRTDRTAAFVDSGYTITSANQARAVIFALQPRSREIQFRFTYTTNGTATPELLSYDPLFEVLNRVA